MLVLLKNITVVFLYFVFWILFLLSLSGKVKYGLLFLVPLLPLQNVLVRLYDFPLGNNLNDILLIGMIIGWVLYKGFRRESLFERSPYNKILLLYFIFTYITLWHGSTFLGLSAPTSALDPRVQTWKNYMILPLLFLLTLNNVKDKKELKILFFVMCGAMLLMNLSTMRQISWITAWWNRNKIKGTFMWLGVNEVAAFYATYTFVLIGLFLLLKDKKWKIILGILILQNLFCDLFLYSRGAYLATLAGFSLIGLLRNKKLLIVLAILLIFWQTLLPQDVISRIEATEQIDGGLDPSASRRIELWKQSIEYFKMSPVIGIGFNTFGMLGRMDTHNVYLKTLAEQGLFGLCFLLLIMGLAFKRSLLLYRKSNDLFLKGLGLGFCACVVAVMVGNIFGDRWTYLALGAYFWVFLGMVEKGNILADSEQKIESRNDKKQKAMNCENNYTPKFNNKLSLAEALKGSAGISSNKIG